MFTNFLKDYCYISSSVLFGLAGIATIELVCSLHLLLLRVPHLMHEKRKKRRTMKGVVIRSYHGISSIEVRNDLEIPRIRNPDEILIKVMAAGLDTVDLMVTWGHGKSLRSYFKRNNEHTSDESTVILGRECSGIVLQVGQGVSSIFKGDEVWAVSPYSLEGLLAEYVVVKEDQVALKPRNITFEEAASLPYTAIRVCNAIISQASLNSKQTKNKRVLVLGGNSPSGLFAIQLLKAWGGNITTAVPTAGLPMCHVLDADDIIVYTVTEYEIELRKRKRFDIVINTIGTIIHRLCVDVSAPGGKVITFTTTSTLTDRLGVTFGSIMNVVVKMTAWFKKIKKGMTKNFWWDDISYDKEYLIKTCMLVEEGKVSPIVENIFDIGDAVYAFQQLAKFDNVGKSVIRISK